MIHQQCSASLRWGARRSDHDPRGAIRRIQQLQVIGVEGRLPDMLSDESADVRERVTSALDNFHYVHPENDGEMSFEDPIDLLDVSVDGS